MSSLASQRLSTACGIAGPIALAAYFAAPAFASWPFAGATPTEIVTYATAHQTLFYAGAWLQGTGTVLCVVFFIALLNSTGSLTRPAAVIAIASAAALLAVVLVEGAFLAAVPAAAAAGDTATASTAFALSNGAFLRVFPIAPASVTYMALGAALLGSRVGTPLAYAAIGIGVAFELAGLASIFTTSALAVIATLSALQALWIVSAAIVLWRSAP